MKRLSAIAWILSLLVIVACGGKSTPPPPAANANMQESLKTLQALAENARQQCCQSATPYMVTYGTMIYSQNPNVPASPMPAPTMNACATAIQNFELQFRTIDNGAYANRQAPQQWREQQGRAVINCVGANMQAAGLPVSAMSIPNYLPAAMQLGNNLAAAVPSLSGFQSYVSTSSSGAASVNLSVPQAPAASGNGLVVANGQTNPFSSGVQIMPYLPAIPAGY